MNRRRTQLKVNTRNMWRQAAEQTYQGADLPIIATRETLQNGIDAIRRLALFASWSKAESLDAARALLGVSTENPGAPADAPIRTAFPTSQGDREAKFLAWMKEKDKALPERSKFLAQGRFDVTLNGNNLSWADNGMGMTADTLDEKFLTLGESGKTDSAVEVGGFGIAKAVILGVGQDGWRMQSRNVAAASTDGLDVMINILPQARSGTEITALNIQVEERRVPGLGDIVMDVADRIRFVIAASDFGAIQAYFNGEPVRSFFGERYTRVKQVEDLYWGQDTKATVRQYKRQVGTGAGAFYVRLGGLFQFVAAPEGGELDADIVIDITTEARPESSSYPFTPSRESFRSYAAGAFNALRRKFAVDSESVADDREYVILLPDATDPKERAAADRYAEQVSRVAEDPTFQSLLNDLLGEGAQLSSKGGPQAGKELMRKILGESTAPEVAEPAAQEEGWGWVLKALPGEITAATDTATLDKVGGTISAVATWAKQFGGDVHSILAAATQLRAKGYIDPDLVGLAITEVGKLSRELSTGDVQDQANPEAGTGIAPALVLGQIAKLLEDGTSKYADEETKTEIRKKRSRINPFGTAAYVKISVVNYDPDKAKSFRRNAAKFMPMLVAWERTAKIIAADYSKQLSGGGGFGITKRSFERKESYATVRAEDINSKVPPFGVGFILDDTVLAMATDDPSMGKFVLVHPDRLQEVVDSSKDQPWTIASYLHATICHELAHLPRMGRGHNEAYVVAREDLDVKTAHLLPVIEQIVVRTFKLKNVLTGAAATAARSASWKATREANQKWEAKVQALQQQLQEAQQGQGSSAQVAELQEELHEVTAHWVRARNDADEARLMASRAREDARELGDQVTELRSALAREQEAAEGRAVAILRGKAEPFLHTLRGLSEYASFRRFLLMVPGKIGTLTGPELIAMIEASPEALDLILHELVD